MLDGKPFAAELFHGVIAFISDDSDFTLDVAAVRLKDVFRQDVVSPDTHGIIIAAAHWRLWIDYVDRPHVAGESREMAEWLARHPSSVRIADCKRRLEFSGTEIEPGSDCFGALITTCEVLKGFRGVVVFDLEEGDLFC
jgi:hypothetical protein